MKNKVILCLLMRDMDAETFSYFVMLEQISLLFWGGDLHKDNSGRK